MPTSPSVVPPRIRRLAAELADPKPMRRGSLSERTIKCSKPGCACARDPKARHGPYYSLTQAVGGKTRSRFLTEEQAEMVRQQIDAGREFRGRVDSFWEACEQWADTQLAEVSTFSEEDKKNSQKTSNPKSPRKSNPLRPPGRCRFGFRSSRDCSATASIATGRTRLGATAERRYE